MGSRPSLHVCGDSRLSPVPRHTRHYRALRRRAAAAGAMPPRGKDPTGPKPASTALAFYTEARRSALLAEQPGLDSKELQRAIAEEWKAMEGTSRAPYMEMAHKDKLRYEEEAATHVPDPAQLKSTEAKRPLRDPHRPKKAKSAYAFFSEATRQELSSAMPDMAIDALTKLISQEWRKLGEEQKAPYNAMAVQDQARYDHEMGAYHPELEVGEDEDEDEDFDGDLEAENAYLKRKVAKYKVKMAGYEKKIAAQESQIEELQAAKRAKTEKGGSKKVASTDEDGGATSKAAGSSNADVKKDDSHYLAWCRKVLGEAGELADDEMVSVYEAKGEPGLVKLLAKLYKAEHASS